MNNPRVESIKFWLNVGVGLANAIIMVPHALIGNVFFVIGNGCLVLLSAQQAISISRRYHKRTKA